MILLHAELPHQLYITMNSASTHVLSPGDSWSGRRLTGMWECCDGTCLQTAVSLSLFVSGVSFVGLISSFDGGILLVQGVWIRVLFGGVAITTFKHERYWIMGIAIIYISDFGDTVIKFHIAPLQLFENSWAKVLSQTGILIKTQLQKNN